MLAFASGSLIFLAFIILFFFVIAYGYYTKSGSGINQRPNDGLDGAPGAEGPSRISSAEREQ